MRFFLSTLIGALLLAGCSAGPASEQPAVQPDAQPPSATEPFVFVSDPAMKELMAAKVELLTETLWNANIEESAPKKAEDWKKLGDAAAELRKAGQSMLEPPLAKDQGKWKEETQKFLDFVGVAQKAINEKNLTLLNDTTNKMTEETCSSCHKLYYTGPTGN